MQATRAAIARALESLGLTNPSLASFVLSVKHRASAEGPALAWTDGRTCFYSAEYARLSPAQQVGVMVHEWLHIAMRHVPRLKRLRREGGDPKIWNIATDIKINEAIPLALWLLSYIAAFSRFRPWPDESAPAIAALAGALMLIVGKAITLPLSIALPIYGFGVFSLAYGLHRRLHALRPPAASLTAFFLAIAAGGAVGSSLATFIPPLIDSAPYELVLAIGVATLLLQEISRIRIAEIVAVALLALAGSAAMLARDGLNLLPSGLWLAGMITVSLMAYLAQKRSAALAAVLIVLLGAVLNQRSIQGETRLVERSFYGLHTVVDDPAGGQRFLLHGSTVHGSARLKDLAAGRPVPTTYYHPASPLGDAVAAAARKPDPAITVIGLGTGALACHASPGERWTFIEIDRSVIRIARDTGLFPYLARCAPDARIVEGDGRLALRALPEPQDLIVLDAFSSDSVPTHLMTAEALREAVARLKPGGMVAMHVSNRHLDIFGTALASARQAGLVARGAADRVAWSDPGVIESYATNSAVVLVARREEDLAGFGRFAVQPDPAVPAWTDQRSELLTPLLRQLQARRG